MFDFVVILLASLFAGFVDAIVGGGGLILVPALFSVFPNAAPATLLGINKGAALLGTTLATVQYARHIEIAWLAIAPAAVAAAIGSGLGAWTVTQMSPLGLRKAMPAILLCVLVYTLLRKDLGQQHTRCFTGRSESVITSLIGFFIGFYDGFFGPGAGSLFIFLFVRVLGYDFLHASASAKLLNTATNLSALTIFISCFAAEERHLPRFGLLG